MSTIAVVGAGLIGLSCAWHLARDGHRVVLFDVSSAPREASWAAAGMLAPHHEATAGDALWRLCAAGLERWPGFLADLGLPPEAVDWQAGGGWLRADDLAELERLESGLRWLRIAGIDVLRLSPAAFARTCPGVAPGVGAVWLPGAQVDPRAVLSVLRSACATIGVEDRSGVAVSALDTGLVQTDDGVQHVVDEVVLASGAWTPALAELLGVALPGSPVKGQLVRLTGPTHLPGFVRQGHRYLLTRRDGSVVIGATMVEAGFDRTTDDVAVADLAAWAATVVPALAGSQMCEVWTGLRPRLAGGLPVLGRVRPGLCVASGHFRNGVLLTPLTGQIMADVIAGRSSEWTVSAFDPQADTA